MSILKEISDKGATIAWSPLRGYPALLATGTKVGALEIDPFVAMMQPWQCIAHIKFVRAPPLYARCLSLACRRAAVEGSTIMAASSRFTPSTSARAAQPRR